MIRVWRDTPKPGETDGQWFYSVSSNGHVIKTQGDFPTEDEARAAGEAWRQEPVATYPNATIHPVENILRAERDGAMARLAVAERDRDEWKRRAIKAEGLLADIQALEILLTQMLSDLQQR